MREEKYNNNDITESCLYLFIIEKVIYFILASPIGYLAKYLIPWHLNKEHVSARKKCANKLDGHAKLLSVFF